VRRQRGEHQTRRHETRERHLARAAERGTASPRGEGA
jgi:hypothetical protein